MKIKFFLIITCISFFNCTNAQRLLNDSGSLMVEQDSANKNMFIAKILNFNGSPDEYWSMFSTTDTLNVGNYYKLLNKGMVFPQGKHSIFYPDSKLKFEENYYLKARTGEFKGYYNSGEVRFIGSLNDKSAGTVTHYYPDGSIRRVGKLVNLLPEGKVTEYYPDGKILSVTHYWEGKKDGKYSLFYPDGKQKRNITYTRGLAESEKCFDSSGKVIECTPLISGAEFPGGDEAFKRELDKIIYQPKSLTDTSACSFLLSVDATGKVQLLDYNSREGLPLFQAIENWVKQLPNFLPAICDGINKESQVDITFPALGGKILWLGGMNKSTVSYWKYDHQEDVIESGWVYEMPGRRRDFVFPSFPGGEVALRNFIGKNLVYPSEAQRLGIQGTVLVSFTVDEEGNVMNPVVRNSVHPALDSEAIRVVNMLPKWKPAISYGKPVSSSYAIPVSFALK